MAFEGPEKRKKLLVSMGILAAIVVGAGLGTMAFTGYFRSQDPIYQCIENPEDQPYQLSIPVTAIENGFPVRVPVGVGMEDNCIRPIHTLEQNVIHVGYSRPHEFTLGHFLYYWIGNDLGNYDTKVYVNGELHTDGSFLDIPLRQGDSIRIEFTSRN
ncbi:MAG: hypothetical protein AB1351_11765 [Thermoproteota archaeon]